MNPIMNPFRVVFPPFFFQSLLPGFYPIKINHF